ncbi:restriction endonuclease subunit S [Lactiplantibacillus plantarum]|nr:restriction endonuclease subunit S [Lactiplantibacillus plantarum]
MKNENLVPKVRFKGFSDPWEQRKWADLIDISTDMVDPRDVEFSELPHVGPGNIEAFSGQLLDNVNTVEKDHLISGKFHFYKGNIIYGKINPQLAKYIWADFEGLSSADTYVLTTKSANILNQGFIFYLLQTRNFYKYSVSVSMRTGMPKINRSELDAYSFLCPQSPEQIKIVQTIKILDDLIAANEDKLEQLKTLKKLMMQKIFSQEWRFKGFTDPWEQRKLLEIADRLSKSSNSENLAHVEYADIISGEGRLKSESLIQKRTDSRSGIQFVAQNVLYGKLRPYLNNWLFPNFPGIAVGDFWVFQAKKGIFAPFLYALIQSPKYQQVANISTGTKMPRSDWKKVSGIHFEVPIEFNEQRKIGHFFLRLDSLIAANEDKLNQLKKLKKYLMQNMFV